MNSMTGFGKAEVVSRTGKYTVEISSVNNRYLEISTRLPRPFFALEARIRKLLGEKLSRGKINIYVGYEEPESSPSRFRIDATAARAYHRQLLKLKRELRLAGELSIRDLVLLPDIADPERGGSDVEASWPALRTALDRALRQLVAMRRREGAAMARDMRQRLRLLRQLTVRVKNESPQVVQRYRQKLTARISELVIPAVPNGARLEEEIAIFAERADTAEECTRLMSHIQEYRRTTSAKQPVGKRLNFVLQEMNREVNTIASKCSDLSTASTAISLKEEIEKLRELVQNVE